MRATTKIPELKNYQHWLKKAIFDYSRYKETFSLYALTDSLLTLNAVPEWILNDINASETLRLIAEEKITIMKGRQKGFIFDENKLHNIDQQLRFIRIFCNHSKHGAKKEKLPEISMHAPFPLKFPICFEYIQVGKINVPAKNILKDVIAFWQEKTNESIEQKNA